MAERAAHRFLGVAVRLPQWGIRVSSGVGVLDCRSPAEDLPVVLSPVWLISYLVGLQKFRYKLWVITRKFL
jgi:hypothetical protein